MIRTLPICKADELPLDFEGAERKLQLLAAADLEGAESDFIRLVEDADSRDQRLELLAADLRRLKGWLAEPHDAGEILDDEERWVPQLSLSWDGSFEARGPFSLKHDADYLTPYWVTKRLMDTGALALVGLTAQTGG